MYYYLIETPMGTKAIKTSILITNKEQARSLVNGAVCFFSKVSRPVYLYNKIFKRG